MACDRLMLDGAFSLAKTHLQHADFDELRLFFFVLLEQKLRDQVEQCFTWSIPGFQDAVDQWFLQILLK
jgi:hypothetical protein